jgi:hypothetical protein
VPPGHNAFVGFKDAHFYCILVFNFCKPKDEKRERIECESLLWGDSLHDIDKAIQESFPSAFIHFLIPFNTDYKPINGNVFKDTSNHPLINLAHELALKKKSPKNAIKLVEKIIEEIR